MRSWANACGWRRMNVAVFQQIAWNRVVFRADFVGFWGSDAIFNFSDNQRGHVHATDGASFGSCSWAYDPQCLAGISVRLQVAIMEYLQYQLVTGFCPTVSAPNDMLLWIDLATNPWCQGSALILDILTHVLQLQQWLAALCWWVWDTPSEAGTQVSVASCLANMVHQQRFSACVCMFVWTNSHHTILFNLVDCFGVLGIDAVIYTLFPLRKACHCCLVAYQTESRLVSNGLSSLVTNVKMSSWHPTQDTPVVPIPTPAPWAREAQFDMLWNADSIWKQKEIEKMTDPFYQGSLHRCEL